jgi:hypothetical protein
MNNSERRRKKKDEELFWGVDPKVTEISGVARQNGYFLKEKFRGGPAKAPTSQPERRSRIDLLHNGQRRPVQEAQGYEPLMLLLYAYVLLTN